MFFVLVRLWELTSRARVSRAMVIFGAACLYLCLGLTPAAAQTATDEERLIAIYLIMTGAPPDGATLDDLSLMRESGMNVREISERIYKQNEAQFRARFPAGAQPEETAERLVYQFYDRGGLTPVASELKQFAARMMYSGTRDYQAIQSVVAAVLRSPAPAVQDIRERLRGKVAASAAYAERVGEAPLRQRVQINDAVLSRIDGEGASFNAVMGYLSNVPPVGEA